MTVSPTPDPAYAATNSSTVVLPAGSIRIFPTPGGICSEKMKRRKKRRIQTKKMLKGEGVEGGVEVEVEGGMVLPVEDRATKMSSVKGECFQAGGTSNGEGGGTIIALVFCRLSSGG